VQPPTTSESPRWPGPSVYTLLAWVEVELLLEAGAQVDAAHAIVSDAAQRAFGPGWVEVMSAAARKEGVPADRDGFPSLAALRSDEDRAARVLDRLRRGMRDRTDEQAPDVDLVWRADDPDHAD
jgi:hypothetical protein